MCGSERRRRTKPRGGTAPFQPDFLEAISRREARRAAATRAVHDGHRGVGPSPTVRWQGLARAAAAAAS